MAFQCPHALEGGLESSPGSCNEGTDAILEVSILMTQFLLQNNFSECTVGDEIAT